MLAPSWAQSQDVGSRVLGAVAGGAGRPDLPPREGSPERRKPLTKAMQQGSGPLRTQAGTLEEDDTGNVVLRRGIRCLEAWEGPNCCGSESH